MIIAGMGGKALPFLDSFTSIAKGAATNESIQGNLEDTGNRIFEGIGVAGSALVIGGVLLWRKEKKSKTQNQAA